VCVCVCVCVCVVCCVCNRISMYVRVFLWYVYNRVDESDL
jgi:hypothetical protein